MRDVELRPGGRTAGGADGLRQRSRHEPGAPEGAGAPAPAARHSGKLGADNDAASESAADAGNEYDFYAGLPKPEVVVPEKEHGTHVDAAARIDRPGTYFLQAGSYRDLAEAERVQGGALAG